MTESIQKVYLDHSVKPMLRRIALAGASCPSCWANGTLTETVSPCATHQGYFQCGACPWNGPGKQLEVIPDENLQHEIRKVYDESCHRREPGGGDDGLSMTWDYPVSDDSIVQQTGVGGGRGSRGKKIEPADAYLSVREVPRGLKGRDVLLAIESRLQKEEGL